MRRRDVLGMKKIVLFSPTGYIGAFIKKAFQQEETVQLYEIVRGSDLTQYNGQYDIMVYSATARYVLQGKASRFMRARSVL